MRAEKTLKIEDKEYKAKMTLDTILRIEESLDMSIYPLAKKFEEPSVRQKEVCAIIYCAIRSGGNDIKESDILRFISNVGIVEATKIAGQLLVLGLNVSVDNPDQEKKSNP
tara:strand:- start:4891 stop:5223 length:333 start_codon:yes stop_codon:yes gene_type:complete